MNNIEKAKVLLFVVVVLAMCIGGAYAGWKYPELYIIPLDGHYITPYIIEMGKINIVNICGTDPRPFQPFVDKFWCLA